MKRLAQVPESALDVGMTALNRSPRASDRAAKSVHGFVCGRCRRTYRSTEWHGLELVEVLDSSCVRQVLTDWPVGHSIEVRRCRWCGGEIARLARSEDAPDGA